MKTNDLRSAFLEFFAKNGHQVVASSQLIPGNDPTLLFTNSGMVQFKDVFLGQDKRDYKRATTSQRCVRAGGKHNDLENVGYTARHHTFFEMLGNFSFGDYFKRDAIQFAWKFLIEVLRLPKEKLWVTVYKDDDEAADIWANEIGVSRDRITRCGEADNFWQMGDTGPCGPCTEIFYDHGPEVAGGPPGSPDADGDRYIEIWNLVFMQFERQTDGSLIPLPKPSVDTGMGLERIAAVMQGVHSNYEIDIFQTLIAAIRKVTGYGNQENPSLHVIADHIRSSAFLIADGVIPSNESRGYVLRRIIRRAIRHGSKLGCHELFFSKLVKPLVQEMGAAYPELAEAQAFIEKCLLQEEEQFARTLQHGLRLLEQDIAELTSNEISGETLFKLYDTYGFPVDLTGDIARERGLTLDLEGFEQAMAVQRSQSQASSQFGVDYTKAIQANVETEFCGYDHTKAKAKIALIFRNGEPVQTLQSGEEGILVLDTSPFYPEGGGQVGDQGEIRTAQAQFRVSTTQKAGKAIAHYGKLLSGKFSVGDAVDAEVDVALRSATKWNHSATHLLHAALRKVLGSHVLQKGSLVDATRTRFDFAHFSPVTPDEIRQIEILVNEQIRANHPVKIEMMTPEAAKKAGAMALFGEKYGDAVRVLSMGEFSKELCGGTHVNRTGDIGLFKIIQETGIAAGIRRIEAITGNAAVHYVLEREQAWNEMAEQLRTAPDHVMTKIQQVLTEQKQLAKEVERLQAKLASSSGGDLLSKAKTLGNIKVLVTAIPGADMKALRTVSDQLKNQIGRGVVVLIGVEGDAIQVVSTISKELIGQVPEPTLYVELLCGRGGGRDDMAQGGGPKPSDLDERINKIYRMIEEKFALV